MFNTKHPEAALPPGIIISSYFISAYSLNGVTGILDTVKELVYDHDDYPDSPWLYGEGGIEWSEMQHLTKEEGTKLLDEWENDYTRIPVTPLREYAEMK